MPRAILPATFLTFLVLTSCTRNSDTPPDTTQSQLPASRPIQMNPEGIWQRRTANKSRGNGKGEIRGIKGEAAEISADNGATWKRPAAGVIFFENSVIRTGPNTSVDFFLGENGGSFRVEPESFVRLVVLDLEDSGIEKAIVTLIELESGQLSGYTKKMSAVSIFLIRTHRGTVTPFGEFNLEADGGIRAERGGDLYSDGQTHRIPPGEKMLF